MPAEGEPRLFSADYAENSWLFSATLTLQLTRAEAAGRSTAYRLVD